MSISDLQYAVVFLTAVKCGYKVSANIAWLYVVSWVDITSFFCHLCRIWRGWTSFFWSRSDAQSSFTQLKWHKRSVTYGLRRWTFKSLMFSYWMTWFMNITNITHTERHLWRFDEIQFSFFTLLTLLICSILFKHQTSRMLTQQT